ncbi:MFS transporter [Shumkonia mesophila]|uniref:MFS transporter n=1 Tax=Shumkonia mesophila TaxID=2838854 RepID=UPI00293437F2|nr:MFS transporter [Shumkonia mesophila]
MPESSPSASSVAVAGGRSLHPLYPWLVWATGTLLFCYAFFHRVAPSVMVSDLMRDFQVGGAILGTLSAFYFYPYALLQIPLGNMLDRWGPRRVIACAAAFCGLGTAVFAVAGSVEMAYVGRAMIGAGAAFGWIGTLTLITLWFPPRRFALVTGLTSLIGMVGAVGGQAPLAAVVSRFGWRPTLLWASLYGVVLAVIVLRVVRDRRDDGAGRATAAQHPRLWRSLCEVAAAPQVWAAGLVVATVSVPLMAFGGLWGVPYMVQAHGMTRPEAAASMSVILASWGLGAPILGWLSDRIQSRKIPILTGTTLSFGAILFLIYVPGLPRWLIFGLLAMNGFAGAAVVTCYAAGRENTRAAVSGTTMGLINALSMGLTAIYQPLIGWLLDLGWEGVIDGGARVYSVETYQMAFLSLAACGALAVAAALCMRDTRCRPVGESGKTAAQSLP